MRRLVRWAALVVLLGALATYLIVAAVLGVFDHWVWFGPLISAGLAVVAAAWVWRSSPAPVPAPVDEWLVWDGALDADQAEQVRQMLRAGYVPAHPVDGRTAV